MLDIVDCIRTLCKREKGEARMAGKCPGCGHAVTSVVFHPITIRIVGGTDRKGNSYCCASCSTVISIEMDPLAIRTEIVKKTAHEVEQAIIKWK